MDFTTLAISNSKLNRFKMCNLEGVDLLCVLYFTLCLPPFNKRYGHPMKIAFPVFTGSNNLFNEEVVLFHFGSFTMHSCIDSQLIFGLANARTYNLGQNKRKKILNQSV